MTNTRSIDSLHVRSINGPSVPALRIIGLCALRLVVVVAKHTSPLLHSLLVILGLQSAVGAAVVDLHLRATAVVSGVHVKDYIGPGLRSCRGLAIGAGVVPGVDATTAGNEAAGANTRVDDGGLEHIWVGSSHDVLWIVLVLLCECTTRD